MTGTEFETPAAVGRRRRLQFSLRSLLIGVAVFAALLGLGLRFGPQVLWRFGLWHSRWGMSREEFAWHRWLLSEGQVFSAPGSRVETPAE